LFAWEKKWDGLESHPQKKQRKKRTLMTVEMVGCDVSKRGKRLVHLQLDAGIQDKGDSGSGLNLLEWREQVIEWLLCRGRGGKWLCQEKGR